MSAASRPRVGVLGAGQLALMLAHAGEALGVEVLCAGRPTDCAGQAAPVLAVDLHDHPAVVAFAARADLVTIESENIDAAVLSGLNLFPNQRAVAIAQDRLLEKQFFQDCGIAVVPYAPVDSLEDLQGALAALSAPAILKTRRMGYDGKGQVRLTHINEAAAAWRANGSASCILEAMMQFDTEVSLIAARSAHHEIAFYPLIENFHREGILRKSVVPYLEKHLQPQAEEYLHRLLTKLNYVGILAVEFFVQGDRLLANEMAPRVHNSGHWTIEGAETSQFENHLRAILGLPLGSTESRATVMLNCIGAMPSAAETELFPALARHDYGKAARPGRKVGHLTFPASDLDAIAEWERRLNVHMSQST